MFVHGAARARLAVNSVLDRLSTRIQNSRSLVLLRIGENANSKGKEEKEAKALHPSVFVSPRELYPTEVYGVNTYMEVWLAGYFRPSRVCVCVCVCVCGM